MNRILCLLLCLQITALANDGPYRPAGAAAVDITPDYPVRLSGYGGRRAPNTGVSLHIFAKALAIGSDAEDPAMLVTVDNVGARRSPAQSSNRHKATDVRFPSIP